MIGHLPRAQCAAGTTYLRVLVRLLKSAAHGGDALGVEAEPVHPSHVAGVFDLEAPIHHRPTAHRPPQSGRLPR